MKRRDFLGYTAAGIGIGSIPRVAMAATPCAPPALAVDSRTFSTTCRPSTGVAPPWFENAPTNTWITIAAGSNQTVKNVLPTPVPSNTYSHPSNIFSAWTGGGFDQVRGEYLLCANGGHGDYPGNECYALSLRSPSPAWRRLSDPTPQSHIVFDNIAGPRGAIYLDGRPRAMHSTFEVYGDGRVWFPEQNSYTGPGGQTAHAVISYNRDYLGDGAVPLPWTPNDLGPWTLFDAPDFAGGGSGAAFGRAIFDPVRHKVWAFGGNNNTHSPYYWSVDTQGSTLGQSRVYRKSESLDSFSSWAICAPDLRIAVMGGTTFQKIVVFHLDRAGQVSDHQTVSNVTGTGHFSSGAGGAYVPASRSIAIANPKLTGNAIHHLRIPTRIVNNQVQYDPSGTWAWETSSPEGVKLAVPEGGNNDVYSKWGLIEDMGNGQSAIIVALAYDGPTYVLKVPKTGL
jgi:hypothetical protein